MAAFDEPTERCLDVEVLAAYVDGQLAASERAAVDRHIDLCGACRRELSLLVSVRSDGIDPFSETTSEQRSGRPKPAPRQRTLFAGRYELGVLLGSGGMGSVHEAYDRKLDRSVALKLLRHDLAGSPDLAERLVRESRIMARLAHPATVTVYDVGQDGGAVFIAMELIRGETLTAFLERVRPTWRQTIALFERAGEGLAAAHDEGIIHRDFKPDNVLVEVAENEARRVVVTDFGIARSVTLAEGTQPVDRASDVRLTSTGVRIGTPAYMAPEQLDAKPVDARADIFAFCVAVWEALLGERPFPGLTIAEIRTAMSDGPKSARRVDRRLRVALERGLAVDSERRWPDMRQLISELHAIRMRRARVLRVSSAVALAAAAVAGTLVLRGDQPSRAAADPCAAALARLSQIYDPPRAARLAAALARDPATRDAVIARLEHSIAAWRTTHGASCHADARPEQPPAISACLDARLTELDAYVQDLIADGPADAIRFGELYRDPAECAAPPGGILTARVPSDAAMRRRVTALRHRVFELEIAIEREDYAAVIKRGRELRAAARAVPFAEAELVFEVGSAESAADDPAAEATLREAAALAMAEHSDHVVAVAMLKLAASRAQAHDPARALEYLGFSDASIARLGQPASLAWTADTIRAGVLSDSGRTEEAEAAILRALRLARTKLPDRMAQTLQGMAWIHEDRGQFDQAVATYQEALAAWPETEVPSSRIVLEERLATNLAHLGKLDEAQAHAEEALRRAERAGIEVASASLALAGILHEAAQETRAFDLLARAIDLIERSDGPRSESYAGALMTRASMWIDDRRYAEARDLLARACEIVAFRTGADLPQMAECRFYQAQALRGLHHPREALAILDDVAPRFAATYGDSSSELGQVLHERGVAAGELGRVAAATTDLERAIELSSQHGLEPGYAAQSEVALAQLLWRREPKRARELLDDALAKLQHAGPSWKQLEREAKALATR
jgi:eukaryotic-like serine/threonine-protein kinase